MKKKMIIAAVFVFALALTASATFAFGNYSYNGGSSCCTYRFHRGDECCPKVEVDADTNTTVRNYVDVKADTGDNAIYGSNGNYVVSTFNGFGGYGGYGSDEAKIETGEAYAGKNLQTDVWGAIVDIDAPSRGTVDVDADTDTYVKNVVDVKADSGDNWIRVSRSDAEIDTDDAAAENYTHTRVYGSTVVIR